MNVNTGELRELADGEQTRPTEVTLTVGEVVELKGVKCRVGAINVGKQRVSLTPIGNGRVREASSNPVSRMLNPKEYQRPMLPPYAMARRSPK